MSKENWIHRFGHDLTRTRTRFLPATWLVTLLSLSLPAVSWADAAKNTANDALSFAQVMANVQQYQQQTSVLPMQQTIATAHVKQSQLWKNPSLTVQQTGFQSDRDRQVEIGITQPLDLFGQRRSAQQLAQIGLSQVALNQQIYQQQSQLAVKYLWSQVLVLQEEQNVIRAQLVSSQANVDATRLRYQAGSIAKLDLDRSLLAHIEIQRQTQQVEQSLQIAKKQLANLWGAENAHYAVRSPSSLWPVETQQSVNQAGQFNLVAQAAKLQEAQQQATLAYLRAKARPNPNVLLGITRSKSADLNRTDNQLRLGIEIPLNLFNRQQYAVQVVNAKQQMLQQQQRGYQQQNLRQIETLLLELQGLKQQYDLLNEQQIPLMDQVHRQTLLGFKVGKYAMTDVQQASIQLQEQRLKKIQLLKQAWQKSLIAESLAAGIDPELVMAADAMLKINQALWQSTQELNPVTGAE